MSGPLLRLEGVSKTYPPTVHPGARLRAFWQLLFKGRAQGGTKVLDGIDLTVERGESVAVIGSNGAGKSTLLKIITGVVSQTDGSIGGSGTRAALLELGAGFDPEYSGIENIRVNAALLGLDQKQVAKRFDEILEFADIGDSVYEPVKHYSSGMVVRLGFAVVATVRPDLLITDEVLAVGDESFQKKCIRWMEDYLDGGGTLLMVSHNMYQVQKLCRRACWIHHGRMRRSGDVFDVTQAYLAWHERNEARELDRHRKAAGNYRVCAAVVTFSDGDIAVEIGIESPDDRAPVVLVGLVRIDGTPVYGVSSDQDGFELHRVGPGRYGCHLVYAEPALLPGSYRIQVHAMDPEGLRVHDSREVELTIKGQSRELGLVRLPHRWQ